MVSEQSQFIKVMAILSPQRDALESLARRTELWPENKAARLTKKTTFMVGRKIIYLLGVCMGAAMRKNPNLHIAVFGTAPPSVGFDQNGKKIKGCKFGGLITGPDTKGRLWVEGLMLRRLRNGEARLLLTGRRTWYRWV